MTQTFIKQLPALTRDIEQAKIDLDKYGCARIENALTADELEAARQRVDQQAAGERRESIASFDGAAEGPGGPNQWIWNLINKGEIFRKIIMKSMPQTIMEHLLGEGYLLSSFTAHIAGKNGVPQPLHKDGGQAPDETSYPIVANIMWLLDDFTDINGATRIVPGSHRLFSRPQPGESVETIPAEGPAGSAFVFDGRLWHGTGSNQTDRPRRGMLSYHCRGFVRQQENFTLSLAPDVMPMCSDELLKKLGFSIFGTLGGVRSAYPDLENGIVQRPTSWITELE